MEHDKLEANGLTVANGHSTPVNTRAAVAIEPAMQADRSAGTYADATPLSFGQRRLWFLEQLEPGSPLHHISQLVRIKGALDIAALEWSLASLVERHEALRTTFTRHGNDPVQVVSRHWTFRLARTDLSGLDSWSNERELARLAQEEATQPFDLRSDVLLRARLVCLGDHEHVLLLTLHQMAADTASMAVLHRELGALYAAFSSGGISLLPDLPFQYADYAAWQREYLQGEVLRRLVAFWRGQLADAPSLLAIPSDRHRPPAQSRRGAVCTTVFSAKLVETLNEFSHAHGATLFMTLLTAFKTVLHRYTGQEDIVVGTPLSGRNREGTGDLIGLFANTLVLRTPFAGDPTFVELLARVRDLTLTSAAHQDLPFEKLIDELHPKRDLSYDPVCQVLFALHDTPAAALKMDGLKTSVEDVHTCTAKTDLNVWAVEEPTGLRVSAEYSLDLFEAGTVERLLGHFRTMLEAITVDPHQRISLLPLLTSLEHMRILSDWNATAVEYPRDRCIHQLFEEQVARTPEATALVFNDRELSYVALNQLADKVAKRLRACGVGPDTLVALCVERSLEMMVGLLGIFKAGAAYVPLDPAFPEDRLTFMLEDSEAPVLVTQRHLLGLFGGMASVICLDADPASDEMPSDGLGKQNADAATSKPENLAYILYTSGSTGRPKGVMISHRNVINFFAGMDRVLGPEPGVWLAVTSISFDISVLELFWTLTRGFKVVILADQAGMKSAKNTVVSPVASKEEVRSLDEQLARHRITHLQCTPSFARLITRMPVTLSGLRPLRRMLVGGEALPADLAEVLGKAMDGDLINMYGPTETTVWSTTHKVQGVRSGTVDIGRPIANTEIYILDRHRQPLPVGIPGELYIGGDGLARGYWRRPELTTERFVEHPFSPGKARLYRTGDLARYRADGVIEFLGRADHQVKIRGHRIELGEIEAVLAQHPGVVQCVVVVRTDKAEDPRMAAYVVPAPSVLPDGTELRNVLRGKLPDHMVPDSFVFLERLPLTPNGKIDRNALPAPARKPAVAHAAHGHSSLPAMEQAIAAIWKDILSVDDLSPDDNFFDSGGRSFQVVQVKSRLYESLGVDLPVIKLFQYPTIRSLADFIGTQSSETDAFHNRIQERTRRRQHAMANWRMNSEEAKL